MALNLEKHLKELCERHKLDLYLRLERVRISAEAIWKEQRLKWFTDHRATTHSRYIIEHLGSVLENLQNSSQRLNAHELYILLAACYLHDIGMQDFVVENGRSVEHFNEEDYMQIRKNHPKRGRELIINRTLYRKRDEFKIDLDDDPQYLVPIALVSQGHGSTFFIDTVKELQSLAQRPGNMPLRGDLLTALLLMGDELDLHERRATFPKEFALSPISLLHHHIHHYVTSVEVIDGRTPKHRLIRLTTELPQDSDEYRPEVRNWLTTKLLKQCALTNPILEASTQGELMWDNKIEIRETIDSYNVRRSLLASAQSVMALHILRRELVESQTVNRAELVKAIKGAMKQSRQQFQAVQIVDHETSDWSHLVKWLREICSCLGFSLVRLAFQQSIGHGPSDILYRFSENLERLASYTCSTYVNLRLSLDKSRQDKLEVLGKALMIDLHNCTETLPLVLLLERLDKAESETMRWLTEWLLPELSKQNIKLLVIFTQFDNEIVNDKLGYLRTFRLEPFTKDQIVEYLQSESGFSTEQAKSEANYLISLSSGSPLRILTGLLYKQKIRVNIL